MHFAIGLTHPVLITEGEAQLVIWQQLPSRLSWYLLEERSGSRGGSVGWLDHIIYLRSTSANANEPTREEGERERGCWKNVGSENSASSRDQPMEGELGGDDATTGALS